MSAPDDPREGLPGHLFRYVSSLVPMVNVDLLLTCERRGMLLAWRHDEFYGPGWHLPGGIIRFKESALDRLRRVGETELGCTRFAEPRLVSAFQIMNPHRDVRGHFLSFLFAAEALEVPDHPAVEAASAAWRHGDAAWHRNVPEALIPQHHRYRAILEAALAGGLDDGALRGNLALDYSPAHEQRI